jgi:large subunit ribosomal protein L15
LPVNNSAFYWQLATNYYQLLTIFPKARRYCITVTPFSQEHSMSQAHIITHGLRGKSKQRKGRGESSGRGKTSGRGNKGSGARTGTYIRRGYEGGQTEIYRRFPKRGFSNHDFENRFYVVNVADLNAFEEGTIVDPAALMEKGLIQDVKLPVKILGNGQLTKKLTVVAGWYSKSAHEQIAKVGGTANNAKGEAFVFPKPKAIFVPREKPKKKTEEATEARPQALYISCGHFVD